MRRSRFCRRRWIWSRSPATCQRKPVFRMAIKISCTVPQTLCSEGELPVTFTLRMVQFGTWSFRELRRALECPLQLCRGFRVSGIVRASRGTLRCPISLFSRAILLSSRPHQSASPPAPFRGEPLTAGQPPPQSHESPAAADIARCAAGRIMEEGYPAITCQLKIRTCSWEGHPVDCSAVVPD